MIEGGYGILTMAQFVKIDPSTRCNRCDHARAIHGRDLLDEAGEWPMQCLAPSTCRCMEFLLLEGGD